MSYPLSDADFRRFMQLVRVAREQGYTLRRNGSDDLPFSIGRGCGPTECQFSTLDAAAEWLK